MSSISDFGNALLEELSVSKSSSRASDCDEACVSRSGSRRRDRLVESDEDRIIAILLKDCG